MKIALLNLAYQASAVRKMMLETRVRAARCRGVVAPEFVRRRVWEGPAFSLAVAQSPPQDFSTVEAWSGWVLKMALGPDDMGHLGLDPG